MARREEARCELEAAAEQQFGVCVAPEPPGDLGQHAQGGDIGRVLAQVVAQQRLGYGNAALLQCDRGFEQPRVARRGTDLPRIGGVGRRGIADGVQVIAERAPGVGKIRLEGQRATQRRNCRITAAEVAVGECQFVVHRGRLRLGRGQRLDRLHRTRGIALATGGDPADELRHRVARDDAQDLVGLLRGKGGVGLEQAGSMR